jgi:hypothetical protein
VQFEYDTRYQLVGVTRIDDVVFISFIWQVSAAEKFHHIAVVELDPDDDLPGYRCLTKIQQLTSRSDWPVSDLPRAGRWLVAALR